MNDFLNKINSNNQDIVMKEMASNIVKQMQDEGKTLASILNLSEEFLEEIYHLGYVYYNQGKHQEAISLFYILVGAVPQNAKYAFALAAAYHQFKDYPHAVLGFTVTYTLDPKNPLPVYFAADCLIKMNNLNEALQLLDTTIAICEDIQEYATLKERCTLLKKIINTNN